MKCCEVTFWNGETKTDWQNVNIKSLIVCTVLLAMAIYCSLQTISLLYIKPLSDILIDLALSTTYQEVHPECVSTKRGILILAQSYRTFEHQGWIRCENAESKHWIDGNACGIQHWVVTGIIKQIYKLVHKARVQCVKVWPMHPEMNYSSKHFVWVDEGPRVMDRVTGTQIPQKGLVGGLTITLSVSLKIKRNIWYGSWV